MPEETKKKKKTPAAHSTKSPAKATTKRKRTTKRSAPKAAKTKTAAVQGTLRVRQIRSGIGHAETYRRTLRALGLKHHQDEVVVRDNPSMRGMLVKVRHLVRVSAEEA